MDLGSHHDFDAELAAELQEIASAGLRRELRRVESPQGRRITIGARPLLNFSSNDYLGLADHPAVKHAAIKGVKEFGAGSGASRLICGSLAPHHQLEEALAAFKQTEAALTFSSGYAAAVGTITALAGKDDVVVLDKLVHASIVDAARLSGAKLRVFKHNDLEDLQDILAWADSRPAPAAGRRRSRVLIVTESVFSMDGDLAPLAGIVALKEKHGARLMVDEAHATGLFGKYRRGVAEEQGMADRVDVHLGTLGKAIGSAGGFICGSRALVDLLVNRARSFIFSTAPAPAQSAAARAGIDLIQSAEGAERRAAVWSRVAELKDALAGLRRGLRADSAIIPFIIGSEPATVACAKSLQAAGFFIPAIRYPTVPRGMARLRITVTAAHASDDITALSGALSSAAA